MTSDTTTNPHIVTEEDDLSGHLRTTIGRLYRRFRNERPDGSLGDAALEVLIFLEKNGPHTLTELSDAAHVAPASMSQSVNRLTSGGYAVRTPDAADRRKVLFSSTPAGAELSRATRTLRNAWFESKVRSLAPQDQEVLARASVLLGDIADS